MKVLWATSSFERQLLLVNLMQMYFDRWSRCRMFNFDFQADNLYHGRRASLSLEIVVVGCGIGGLTAAYCLAQAGHKVTILEAASSIGDIGAGIQVTPNLTRLLIRWGLGERLKEVSVKPEALSFRRCESLKLLSDIYSYLSHTVGCTGETVAWTKWGDTMDEEYGAPYYHIHVEFEFHSVSSETDQPHSELIFIACCMNWQSLIVSYVPIVELFPWTRPNLPPPSNLAKWCMLI